MKIGYFRYNWQHDLLGHLVSVGWFLAELPALIFYPLSSNVCSNNCYYTPLFRLSATCSRTFAWRNDSRPVMLVGAMGFVPLQ